MKLHKALKLRKKLAGEIAALKQNLQQKNSFITGAVNVEKYNVDNIYSELLTKIQELVGLKYAINEANREIQSKIYLIAEYKGLITFWQSVSVHEGPVHDYYNNNGGSIPIYVAQYDELKRNDIIKAFQNKVDFLQEEMDTFNYTTDIPWDEFVSDDVVTTAPVDGMGRIRTPNIEEIKNIIKEAKKESFFDPNKSDDTFDPTERNDTSV